MKKKPLACTDCRLPYRDPGWVDAIIPDFYWLAIYGEQGGVLCITCMARRLKKQGLAGTPMWIASGPFLAQREPGTEFMRYFQDEVADALAASLRERKAKRARARRKT